MDSRRFDGLIRRFSEVLSRRSLLGGTLGAAVLAAAGGSADVGARRAKAEACIQTGKKCPAKKPRGRRGSNARKPKRLGCDKCCQRRVTQNAQGENVCACELEGRACTQSRECCNGQCVNGTCLITTLPVTPICTALGSACTAASQCCSGICDGVCLEP